MKSLAPLRDWLRTMLHRSRAERDMDAELRSHIEARVEDLARTGLPRAEALRRARLEFGGIERVKEECRESRGIAFIENLAQDLRFALRMLRKSPGFTAVAVLTLALGIGANTAIFSVVSLVLLKRPLVRDPDRVTVVASNNREKGWDLLRVSVPNFKAFRRENDVFQSIAAAAQSSFALAGQGTPEHLDGAQVTANYFSVLGLSPLMGRRFAAREDQPGRNHVVILSYGLWKQHFGSSLKVIGSQVDINGEPCTVIGVMRSGTDSPLMQPQLWTPLVFSGKNVSLSRNSRFLFVLGRLKPGITVSKAQAEITALAAQISHRHPNTEKGFGATVLSLQKFMIQAAEVEASLGVMMGAVLFVLLIACANVAGLLLARASGRRQEIAVRSALGASRFRVVRQLLAESLLIASAGGGLGVIVGLWGIDYIRTNLDWNAYVAYLGDNLHLDLRTLCFSVALTLGVTFLFGLAPALQASKPDLVATLKEAGRAGTGGIRRSRPRFILVTGEIALSTVLLVGAGIFIQAFLQMVTQNPGFNASHVITGRIILSARQYKNNPDAQSAFFERVVRRLSRTPGVEAASATQWLPLEGSWHRSVKVEGHHSHLTSVYIVGSNYFRTLQIPLTRGREFSKMDNDHSPKVAVVNQPFASAYFPKGDAIGHRIFAYTYHPAWAEIVGVVGTVKEYPGQSEDAPQVYVPFLQQPSAKMAVVARTRYAASAVAPLLRRTVWSVDKEQPVENIMTMQEVAERAGAAGNRFMAAIMGEFSGLALALSVIGIYGVIAYSVAQRTHEIGIRVAMGAQKKDVLRLILRQGITVAGVGCGTGLVLALSLPGMFSAMFGPVKDSSLLFTIVGPAIVTACLFAAYIPARRAMRVDPMVALRYE